MTIRLVKNKDIDKIKWDNCTSQSAGFELYMQSSYLDYSFPEWKALIAGDYQAVVPVFEKNYLLWKKIVHPLFTGPIKVLGDDSHAAELLKLYYFDQIKKYNSIISNIDIDFSNSENNRFFQERKYQKLKLDLSGFSPDKQLRKNITKAQKSGLVSVERVPKEEFIKGLDDNLLKSQKILSRQNFNHLKKLILNCDNFSGECIGAIDHRGEIHAGQFLLYNKEQIYFILCYNTNEGRKNSAMHYLLTEIIKQKLPNGGIVNFGGSNIERIANFNHNFGAHDFQYLRFHKKNSLLKFLN